MDEFLRRPGALPSKAESIAFQIIIIDFPIRNKTL